MTYHKKIISNNIEKNIYLIYLFSLPFGRFIDFHLPTILQTYFLNRFCCFFFFFGFIIMTIKKVSIGYNPFLEKWKRLYKFQIIYSLLMATILYIPLGILHGEDTFRASIGSMLFWLIVLLHIYYNYYGLTQLITIHTMLKTITYSSFVILFIGYLQYTAVKVGGPFGGIYTVLTSIFALLPIDKLNRGVVFFGSEPASASTLFALTIPVLLGRIIQQKNKKEQKWYILLILLFIPLFISSGSASVWITLLLTICATFIVLTKNLKAYKFLLGITFIIGFIIAIGYGIGNFNKKNTNENKEETNIEYLLLGKIQDTNNLSTMMRSSTIINNMKILGNYPITGVGDGIQGYFYNKNIPNSFLISPEVSKIYKGEVGIIDSGGAYFPAFFSSYGIIGLFFLLPLIRQYFYFFKRWERINLLNIIFMIFIIIFVASAWFSMGIRQNYMVIVMFTLPIVALRYDLYSQKHLSKQSPISLIKKRK